MGTFRPCVYTGPAGTLPYGTASRTEMGPLTKSIPFGTIPRLVSCKRVDRFQTGTARKLFKHLVRIDSFHNSIQFEAKDVIPCAARNLHRINMLQLHVKNNFMRF